MCLCVCVFYDIVLGCARLYPVATTVQRRTIKDTILQNYHIPAGVSGRPLLMFTHILKETQISVPQLTHNQLSPQTLVQVCLYPLGRSADVFAAPQRFEPDRWVNNGEKGQTVEGSSFRSLAFGFGARQCVGRRIAENEMQLLLMHVSDNRQ